jgi:hypothetical protein
LNSPASAAAQGPVHDHSFEEILKGWIAAGLWIGIIVVESTSYLSSDNTGHILFGIFHHLFGISPEHFHPLHVFHPQRRSLYWLCDVKLSTLSRMEGDLTQHSSLGFEVVSYRFFHDRARGQSGRMAPDLHPFPHWNIARRISGQLCSPDHAGRDCLVSTSPSQKLNGFMAGFDGRI